MQRAASDPLREAEDLLQKQQYAQAEEKLQPLMNEQAKNPQAWFDLGFAQSRQSKTKEAIADYQKAVELAPDWFEANLNLGLDLIKSGKPSAAAPVLRHAVELRPASGGKQAKSRAWLGLAQALEESDPKGSVAAYDRAAELNPEERELVTRAGYLLQRNGDLAGAEQRYAKAAEAGDSNAVSQLVALLSQQHRYAEAAAWLNKYVTQNPRDAAARVQLARLLKAEGKNEDATAMLESARAVSADPEVSRALASLYLDEKQYDKGVSILQELAQKNPNDAQLRWDLGSALLHQHKYPEAEKEMLEALKINPRLESDPWELAYAAQQDKHYELAIRVLDVRAQRLAETPATYFLRAVAYDSLGAVKPAAANYRLFLAADAGKSSEQEFKARHRLKAIEPQ
jgi:Flp pilus assembly protein TadD